MKAFIRPRKFVALLVLPLWCLPTTASFAQEAEPWRRVPQTVVGKLGFPTAVRLSVGADGKERVGLRTSGGLGRPVEQSLEVDPVTGEQKVGTAWQGSAPPANVQGEPTADLAASALSGEAMFRLVDGRLVFKDALDQPERLVVGGEELGTALDMVFVPDAERAGEGRLWVLDSAGRLVRWRVNSEPGSIYSSERLETADGLKAPDSSGYVLTVRSEAVVMDGLNRPVALALQSGNAHLWVANRGDGSLLELDENAKLVRRIDTGLGEAQLWDVAVHESKPGEVDRVYLSATGGVGSTPSSTARGSLMKLELTPLELVNPLVGPVVEAAPGDALQLRFSRPLDARTLTNRTVKVTGVAGTSASAGLRLVAPDTLEVVVPAVGGPFRLVVDGLTDVYGNTLAQPAELAVRTLVVAAVGNGSASGQELPVGQSRLGSKAVVMPKLYVPPVAKETARRDGSATQQGPQASQPQAVYPKAGTLYGTPGQPLYLRLECTPTSAGSAFPANATGKVRLTSALRAVPGPSGIIQYYQDYHDSVGLAGGPSAIRTLSILCRSEQAGPRLGVYDEDPRIGGLPVLPHSIVPAQPSIANTKPDGGSSSCGPSNKAGDPILLDTGVFEHSHCDIKVLGGRMPFRFTRSHRSLDLFVKSGGLYYNLGPFGFGTSHNFDWYIQRISDTALQLKLPDNARYDFARNASGDFVNAGSPNWIGSVLRPTAGGYTLRFKDGTVYGFNTAGFLVSQADRNSNAVTISRDIDNALVQISSVSGTLDFQTSRVSTSDGSQYVDRIESITDQNGRRVFYLYDSSSRLREVRLPDDTPERTNRHTYTYDPGLTGFLKSGTDGRGIVYFDNTYEYNFGRVTRQNQPEGRVYDFTYNTDASGGVVQSVDVRLPNGQTYRQGFNGGQYTTDFRDEQQRVYPVERDPLTNQVRSLRDPLSRQVLMEYDAAGNVKKVTSPLNNITEIEHEPVYNLPVRVEDGLDNATTVAYDSKGNPLRVADPLGHGATMTYETSGQLKTVQNDVDGQVEYGYDGRGRVIRVTAPLGKVRTFGYDNLNRVTSIVDELSRETTYEYDLMDRVKKVIFADRIAFVTMEYDQNGNLKTLADERGNPTRYEYDGMNRLTRRTNPLGEFETLTYGPNNQVKEHTDRLSRLHKFFYDERDNLRRSELFDGTVITYLYDAVNRLTQVADSRDGTASWTYDALDRVQQETTSQAGSVLYEYDVIGRRKKLSTPDGYEVRYDYDTADRTTAMTQVVQSVTRGYSLAYDNANRLSSLSMPNGVTRAHSFDTTGRLSRLLYSQVTGTELLNLQYTHDVADQIGAIGGTPSIASRESTISGTTVNINNQYTAFNGETLSYDAEGNLRTKGATSYTWDVRNRLIGLTGPGVSASFSYDALGRRTARTVNGQALSYRYDGSDIISDGQAEYVHGSGVDDVLSRVLPNGSAEYYLKDHLNSTLGLTDNAGNLTVRYGYSPFGQMSKSGTTSNYFTYTGREDDSTNLYYYRARYYSPELKRFVSEDPIGFAGGDTNLQAYVGNSVISASDPSGLRTYFIAGAGGWGGTAAVSNIKNMGGPGNRAAQFDAKDVTPAGAYQFIPGVTGNATAANIARDIYLNPLQKGEPINVIAYSNGVLALDTVVDFLRSAFKDREIHSARLDANGFGVKPGGCIDIGSNAPGSFWPDDSTSATTPVEARVPAGIDHGRLADSPAWIKILRDKYGFRF